MDTLLLLALVAMAEGSPERIDRNDGGGPEALCDGTDEIERNCGSV
jgi:hypothetical protein